MILVAAIKSDAGIIRLCVTGSMDTLIGSICGQFNRIDMRRFI